MIQPPLTLTSHTTTDRPMLCLPSISFQKQLREVNHAVTIFYFFTFRYDLFLNSYLLLLPEHFPKLTRQR